MIVSVTIGCKEDRETHYEESSLVVTSYDGAVVKISPPTGFPFLVDCDSLIAACKKASTSRKEERRKSGT
jgi:hypothetical protein